MSLTRHPAASRAAIALLLLACVFRASAVGAEESPAEGSPSPAPAATAADAAKDAARFPHLVLIDLRDVLGAPLSWRSRQWELFGLSVAGVGAAALLDGRVRDAERRDHSAFGNQIAQDFEPLGSGGAWAVLGSFYLEGLLRDDARGRAVAEDGVMSSVIAGGLVGPALKFVTGRSRPRSANGTYDFKLFGGSSSFPSGHTTEAFAVASVVATHYDSEWVKGIAYGSAALVGFARLHHQAHFFSDVVGGAVLGTATGRAVVHRNQRERGTAGHRLTVAPLLGPQNQPGVGVALAF
jgi:membrane-associated phospholipid phosphatase